MRRKLLASILIAVMCFCPITASAAAFQLPEQKDSDAAGYKEGEAIVLLKDSKSSMSRKAAARALDVDDIQVADICNFKHAAKEDTSAPASAAAKSISQKTTTIALVRSDSLSTEKLLDKLKASGQVELAAPNYRTKAYGTTNDSYAKYQWALENTGQNAGTAGRDLHPEAIWDKGTTGSSKVVAVIDSGVDYTHEDLKSNMWVNPYQNKLPGNHGYDFTNGDSDPMDDDKHGTHCAGIIGASGNNALGISGINQKVKIMALKALDAHGSGDLYDGIRSYEYISDSQDLGADVAAVNNSYGISGALESPEDLAEAKELSQLFKTIMDITGEKGAVSFCAAGNEGQNNDGNIALPSGVDSPYNISVAASDASDHLAPYSNYGKQSVDLAAPGSVILSTISKNSFTPGIYEQHQRSELCSNFADYEGSSIEPNVWGIPTIKSKTVTTSLDTKNFFNTGKQSLKLTIKDMAAGEIVFAELPYKLNPTNENTYASLAVMGSTSANDQISIISIWDREKDYTAEHVLDPNEIEDYSAGANGDNSWWYLHFKTRAEKSDKPQERKLIIAFKVFKAGDYTLNLDQVGISKENVSASKFGKYTFLDGTSMAAPYAAGTAALIAASDPGLSALEVAATVKKSVRKTDSMAGKVAAGGILDLAKLSKPQAVSSVKLNKTSTKVKKGTAFTLKATIAPQAATEKGVTWKSSNSKVATVDKKGKVTAKGYGKAYITAVSKGKGGKSARCAVTVCYTISYKTGGGKLAKNSPGLYYNEKVSLKKPVRTGYSFKGWYTDKRFKNKITTIKKGTKKNYMLYAKWSKIKVDRTYIKRISKKRSAKMTLSYKKVSGADGYQIRYSRSKNFKKSSYVNTKATKKTVKGLKRDTNYYVKVRAYKFDSAGKKVYGKYSAPVRIR